MKTQIKEKSEEPEKFFFDNKVPKSKEFIKIEKEKKLVDLFNKQNEINKLFDDDEITYREYKRLNNRFYNELELMDIQI
jgi:hypothetical protein